MKPLAVFDVDGTLVDSRATIFEAAQSAFRDLALPEPAYDEVRQIVGLTLHEALGLIAPDLPPPDLDRLVLRFQAAFQRFHAEPGFIEPLYDGAAELLDALRSGGWKIAMATGKSRRGVENVIRMHGWADLFDSTHCSDDGPGKPHPAMLEAAMAALSTPAGRTVMIGDTAHDIAMAKAAGARAQGVAWGFHTVDEIAAAGADHVAGTFAELHAALDRFAAA
ncbi:MAG TPA: HAD-IA family hydrolase [Caulobacteraceae bacterium]